MYLATATREGRRRWSGKCLKVSERETGRKEKFYRALTFNG
jgi:hypothetical protein